MLHRLTAALSVFTLSAFAAQPDPEALKLFEQKARPVLLTHCIKCHGEEKQKGQLRLDSLESALKGGETGPAIVPGKLDKSLLIAAVNHTHEDLAMPPKEDKLSDAARAGLEEWVRAGAPWPDGVKLTAAKVSKKKILTAADKDFWSYQPIKNPAVPTTGEKRAVNAIDHFVAEKLKPLSLSLAPEADRRALIRRATLDLHGMPPTPDDVEAFAADHSPDAYEKLLDRLLASPRYGERYARHWLDLVRYAESDGFKQDSYRPNAWPYRDYVVASMNGDKPYDRFITEQLAGDELDPKNPSVYIGTAFLRLSCYEYNQRNVPKAWQEYLDDITDVCGDVFIATSLSCAKCHDHKFDPILQADYYRFQSFFANIRWHDEKPIATPGQLAAYNAAYEKWAAKTAAIREKIEAIEKPHMTSMTKNAITKFAPEFQEILNKSADKRTPWETQIAELAYRQVYEEFKTLDGKIKAEREKWAALKRELAAFDNEKPKPLPTTMLATDLGATPAPTWLGGYPKKEVVEPGFLSVLDPRPTQIPPSPIPNSTGRRTALAKWLTALDNPLTARVMANRLWQYHFGRGLVATSSDFGHLGEKPSHPELLDWLATKFVDDGWSLKKLNKLIMMSAAYRQSSTVAMSEQAKLKDPDNRLLWRFGAHRLDAEQIRDSMLAISGEMSSKTGGPSADFSANSRGIYTKVLRNTHDPLLEAYDEPDGFFSAATRNVTTTPTQALLLINGQWPLQRAEAFAARLQAMKPYDEEAMVINAFKLAYGRAPSEKERVVSVNFLKRKQKALPEPEAEPAAQKSSARNQYYQSQPMPHRGGIAAFFRESHPEDQLKLPQSKIPEDEFTIEAVVLLESIYESASVRVIASRWNGKPDQPGWSFGITSEKSKHQPRNLILQLSEGVAKKPAEVVVSDLKIELHSPHYVAAAVKLSDTSDAGITFYMRDLSDPDAPLRTASVKHIFKGPLNSPANFVIGGRDTPNSMGWHGLIDDVRLSTVPLAKERLLVNEGDNKGLNAGMWRFEETPGFFKDSDTLHADLVTAAPATTPSDPAPAKDSKKNNNSNKALVDFCHALLNSSEFIYSE